MNSFHLLRYTLLGASILLMVAGLVMGTTRPGIDRQQFAKAFEEGVRQGRTELPQTPNRIGFSVMLLLLGFGGMAIALKLTEPKMSSFPSSASTSSSAPQPALTPRTVPSSKSPSSHRTLSAKTLDDLIARGLSPAQIAQALSLPQRLKLLDQTLETHEHGWFALLLGCPAILIIGRPGSGKSSLGSAIAICRELLLTREDAIRETVACDPNAHLKLEKTIWLSHWRIVGARDDFAGIETEIRGMYKRFADSVGVNNVTAIYDELTAYNQAIKDKSLLAGFLPQVTSKARAAGECVIGLSHNDSLEALGGKAGQARLKDDMVQIDIDSRMVRRSGKSRVVPTLKGTITGLNYENNKPIEQDITLTPWMQPDFLVTLFPEVYRLSSQHNGSNSSQSLEPNLSSSNQQNHFHFHHPKPSLPIPDSSLPCEEDGNDLEEGGNGLLEADNTPALLPLTPYQIWLSAFRQQHADYLSNAGNVYRRLCSNRDEVEDYLMIRSARLPQSGDPKSWSVLIKEQFGLKGNHFEKGKAIMVYLCSKFDNPRLAHDAAKFAGLVE